MALEASLARVFRGKLQRAILAALLEGVSFADFAAMKGCPLSEVRRVAKAMCSRLGRADSGVLPGGICEKF